MGRWSLPLGATSQAAPPCLPQPPLHGSEALPQRPPRGQLGARGAAIGCGQRLETCGEVPIAGHSEPDTGRLGRRQANAPGTLSHRAYGDQLAVPVPIENLAIRDARRADEGRRAPPCQRRCTGGHQCPKRRPRKTFQCRSRQARVPSIPRPEANPACTPPTRQSRSSGRPCRDRPLQLVPLIVLDPPAA